MESIHTTINKELVQNVFKGKLVGGIISLIVGTILFITIQVLRIILDFDYKYIFALSFVFALIAVLGAFYIIAYVKAVKEFSNKTIESDATFYDDYVNVISFNGDVQIEDVKHFYKEMLFFKEKKEYILIYINKLLAVPYANKEGLAEFLKSKGVKKR